uniref:Secreted protein n=1 Tax=Strongyloides stercoralis TaxID=6248 RepID=A0A0K0ET47_STRER
MYFIKVTIFLVVLINFSMSMSIANVYPQTRDESGVKENDMKLPFYLESADNDVAVVKKSLMFNNEAALRLRNLLRRNTDYPVMKVNSNNVPIPQASFYGGMPIVF